MTIRREDITGLVLATSAGGVDRGLQNHHGMPLALHVLLRLSMQVGEVLIHANSNIAAYEAMGAPVWPDALADRPGPLTGVLVGLERCETPWLVAVPCDAHDLPDDLVEQLAGALEREAADLAIGTLDRGGTLSPPFYLLKAGLAESLAAFLHQGESDPALWIARHPSVEVVFPR